MEVDVPKNKDVPLEIGQLVQRGFDHHEHGRVHDALSDWETSLRLDSRNPQVKRLVEFGRHRVAEIEAAKHTLPSRRETVESPIPQFLAALTERKSEKASAPTGPLQDGPTAKTLLEDRETPKNDWSLLAAEDVMRDCARATNSLPHDPTAPDTLEDLHVRADDVRASTNELISECRSALNEDRAGPAALAAELALQVAEPAPPPSPDDLIEPSRALFERAFRAFIGNQHACPIRAIPSETIFEHGLDQRAAFLMSRMDGMTSIADLIDSSGIPHFDAMRVMASLRRAEAIDMLPPLP
jgi:hypothetical protein